MSIATELQNYADGLGDAYDAVNDMSGIVPAHKNMNNLDQAIRTIPQNTGATVTTFHWGGSPNYSMYKDSGYTTAATYSDIATAYASGIVYIADGEDEVTYVMVSDIPDAYTITVTGIGLPDYEGGSASYTYASSTWTKTATEFQKKLTAGTGINISAQNVISATGDETVFYINDYPYGLDYDDPLPIYTDSTLTTQVSYADFMAAIFKDTVLLACPEGGSDIVRYFSAFPYQDADYDDDAFYFYIMSENDYSEITRTDMMWLSNKTSPECSYQITSQQKLTAGSNITISGDTISATDTTYSAFGGATSSVAGSAGLVPAPTTSDPDKFLKGDGTWATPTDTTYTAGTNVQISAQNVISATDTTYSAFTGATASVAGAGGLVPAPAAGDEGKVLTGDGNWTNFVPQLVEMSYGEANAWTKFLTAYNNHCIVYCRASSNSNPGTGSQTRKAFMAYVNDATNPTEVEFQYFRSVKTKTDSQQGDQTYIYKLTSTSGGTWSVETRSNFTKINVDATLTKTYTQGVNASMSLGAKAMTGATSSADGAAGIVPKPVTGDNTKFLRGDGTWAATEDHNYSYTEIDTHTTWLQGQEIYSMTYYFSSLADHGTVSQALPTGWTATVKIEGIMRQGNNVWALPYPYCYLATDGTNLQVANPDFDFTGMDAIITLYYVKTV